MQRESRAEKAVKTRNYKLDPQYGTTESTLLVCGLFVVLWLSRFLVFSGFWWSFISLFCSFINLFWSFLGLVWPSEAILPFHRRRTVRARMAVTAHSPVERRGKNKKKNIEDTVSNGRKESARNSTQKQQRK